MGKIVKLLNMVVVPPTLAIGGYCDNEVDSKPAKHCHPAMFTISIFPAK